MKKKLATLMLSLLLLLSMLAGQTCAADLPESVDTPAQVEVSSPEVLGEPETPLMPASTEIFPVGDDETLPIIPPVS